MISIQPHDAPLGATVTGLDLGRDQSPAALSDLLSALTEHKMVVVPDLAFDPAGFAALAYGLGRPQPHVLDHLHLPGHPEIILLSNIFKDGEPIGVYDGAAFWHSDMSYEAEPASLTMVYAVQTPETGGETHFADMAAAYDALSETMKTWIDGMAVDHAYGNRADLVGESRQKASPLKTVAQQQALPETVRHPLVRRHPLSGRKALYAVSGTPRRIVGMPDDESNDLLDELARHATGPDFATRHAYRVGELVIWDNAQTMHMASLIDPATGKESSRLLYRISLKGYPDWAVKAAA